jgi:8-oxo-dGTP pyrophosphatase MutT (NUDIX family)
MPELHASDDPVFRGLISLKAVIWQGERVVLLRSHRGYWDLPGGKLERGEHLTEALIRECREELGIAVTPGPLLDAGLHHYYDDIVVLVYGCHVAPFTALRHTAEHAQVTAVTLAELACLELPSLYRRAIHAWATDPRRRQGAL